MFTLLCEYYFALISKLQWKRLLITENLCHYHDPVFQIFHFIYHIEGTKLLYFHCWCDADTRVWHYTLVMSKLIVVLDLITISAVSVMWYRLLSFWEWPLSGDLYSMWLQWTRCGMWPGEWSLLGKLTLIILGGLGRYRWALWMLVIHND